MAEVVQVKEPLLALVPPSKSKAFLLVGLKREPPPE